MDPWVALGGLLDEPEGSMALMAELLRVRNKDGRLVRLVANPAQRSFEERRGRHNIVLKARQMGLSTWVAGRFLLRTLLVPGSTTLMVAHTRESAEMLFRTVTRMWANLPAEMRESVARLGKMRSDAMSFPKVDSEFCIASAGEVNAGRGLSVQLMHLSEVARWPGEAAETLAGLRAALAPRGEMVMESTPNGAYGCFFAEWQTAEQRGLVRHFVPWWREPGYVGAPVSDASMTVEELELKEREGLSAEQIGFRRGLAESYGGMRLQEFAEDAVSCFRQSGACVFEVERIGERLRKLPAVLERRFGGGLLVWLPPVPGRRYILAADPAGGGSEGDFAAVQVIDEASGMQCAEMQARVHPRELAVRLAGLAREYVDALVVVERNNHGAAVLAYLEQEGRGLRVYEEQGQRGWLTDAVSRPRMIGGMNRLLSERPEIFASERLLEECRGFVTNASGRAEAAAGTHDDLVMAMAMGQAVRELRIAT